jgi:poly [ADP-ribose] polymerase
MHPGLLVLAQVALGDLYMKREAEYVEKLPKSFSSTKGVGRFEPPASQNKVLSTLPNVQVPCGKIKKVAVGPDGKAPPDSTLLYNEYIVYDTSQVQMQYLVQVTFDYDVDDDMGFD